QSEVPLVIAKIAAVKAQATLKEVVSSQRGLEVGVEEPAAAGVHQRASEVLLAKKYFEANRFTEISRQGHGFVGPAAKRAVESRVMEVGAQSDLGKLVEGQTIGLIQRTLRVPGAIAASERSVSEDAF